MTFFDLIVNGTRQLIRFTSRIPRLKAFNVARFRFNEDHLGQVILTSGNRMLRVAILHRELDLQISSLAQVCTSSLLLLSTFEDLHVSGVQSQPPDITRNMLWLNDRSVAHPGEYFLAAAPAFGICPGEPGTVRCHATARRSPCSGFSLRQIQVRFGQG